MQANALQLAGRALGDFTQKDDLARHLEVGDARPDKGAQFARIAPSSMNTQPWNFYIITGEPLDLIRAGNTERMVSGVPQSREFRTGQAFAGSHRDRQVGVAKQLFSAMGIARDDKEMRQDWVLRGFRQFDAPVCIIVTYDRVLDGSDDTPFDCGAVTTALVNAAWSRGLGAVINSQG